MCTSESNGGGICLACSLHCHEGHKLYELYTKRNFRCDCGNDKFPKSSCLLCPEKEPHNTENIYNHNFIGLYCTCNRPYPDSEDEIEDEMLQCIVCEDWFHTRHLGASPPSSYEEMVCDVCMDSLPFLRAYQIHCPNMAQEIEDEITAGKEQEKSSDEIDVDSKSEGMCGGDLASVIDVQSQSHSTNQPESHSFSPSQSSKSQSSSTSSQSCVESQDESGSKLNHSSDTCIPQNCTTLETETQVKEKPHSKTLAETAQSTNVDVNKIQNAETPECIFDKRMKLVENYSQFGPGYFLSGWRSELCQCHSCLSIYKTQNVEYLLDTQDTITSYEFRASNVQYLHEAGMNSLSSTMGHIQQVEMIHEYNIMKQELSKFLQGFADDKRVVRTRDIEDFFGQLQAHKRRRIDSGEGIPPDSCH